MHFNSKIIVLNDRCSIPSAFSQQTLEQLEVTRETVLSEMYKLNELLDQSSLSLSRKRYSRLENKMNL